MSIGRTLGNFGRKMDAQFGIAAWLRGEPRPPAGGFDLRGEKILDWGWIAAHLPSGPGRALDVGCGESPTLAALLARDFDVTAVDLEVPLDRILAGIRFLRADFNRVVLEPGFDMVVACSAIEHFGLSGRYGSAEDPEADLDAVRRIHHLLKPQGLFLLTVPVGPDAVLRPWHRVYGRARLPLLLSGFRIRHSQGWVKEPWGPWSPAPIDAALASTASPVRYALGQFALEKEAVA